MIVIATVPGIVVAVRSRMIVIVMPAASEADARGEEGNTKKKLTHTWTPDCGHWPGSARSDWPPPESDWSAGHEQAVRYA
jgi:hypothetical protein